MGEGRRQAPQSATFLLEERLNTDPNQTIATGPPGGATSPPADANLPAPLAVIEAGAPVRLFVKRPERMRFVRETGAAPVTLFREGRVFVGEGAKLTLAPGRSAFLASLLYPKGRALDDVAQALLATLAAQGIDIKVTSLTRLGERFAYIIGAEPWENTKPQVLIDKEKFWLVATRLPETRGDHTVWVETRLVGWGEGPATHAPAAIETYEDGVLTTRQKWVRLQTTTALPETLFDPSGSRRRM